MARTAPVSAPTEVVNHKSIVPEPGWFNGDKKTFEDQWRAMKLYLRANKVTNANKKIITVLDRFRGGTAGAFAQQKLNKINGGDGTPSWNAFEAELQLVYSNKMKEANIEWYIVSQIVTYLFCDGLEYRFKELISRVRQVTKDVVKSEV